MKIYLDYIMIINFFFDFIILLTTSFIIKQFVPIKKIINGAFIGGLSILILFINMSNQEMFLFKVIISFLMIYLTFGYKDFSYFFKNVCYLYIISMLLGGTLYFINNQFAYNQKGLVFIHKNYSINIILILILFPLLSYFYAKKLNKLKYYNTYLYHVVINYGNKTIKTMGFWDTGNNLIDPVNYKKVILLDKRKSVFKIKKYVKVPYYNASGLDFLNCFSPDKVLINNKEYHNILIGLTNLDQDNYDVLLNNKLMEE